MAPRFRFQASKFRNIECKPEPRQACYDELQVSAAPSEGKILAVTSNKLAYAHKLDGGGAVRIKMLEDTGKEHGRTPPLLRAHTSAVNGIDFSPFDSSLLATASADATVKIWKLPSDDCILDKDMTESLTTFADANAPVAGLSFHGSAANVLAAYTHQTIVVYDIEAPNATLSMEVPSGICALSWNYDGSALLTCSNDQHARGVDPRAPETTSFEIKAHTGRRHMNIASCGDLGLFLTTGSDQMQERELKIWDPRQLSKHLHRERIDTGIGQLFPLYDPDINLLYLLGKGDRSVRSYELDVSRSPILTSLDHTVLNHMTVAAARAPKQVCDTNECEIARLLSLSQSNGGYCEVVKVRVPRREASREFQQDLYPDTHRPLAAIRADQWRNGRNASPLREKVQQSSKSSSQDASGSSSVFSTHMQAQWNTPQDAGRVASWGAPNSNGQAQPVTKSGWTSGWKSSQSGMEEETKRGSMFTSNTSKPSFQTWASSTNSGNGWNTGTTANTSTNDREDHVGDNEVQDQELQQDSKSDAAVQESIIPPPKSKRESIINAHKLKYLAGKRANKSDLFNLGDKSVSSGSVTGVPLAANGKYWAVPVNGGGGPVLVERLSACGKATQATTTLNGHKLAVNDVAFSPFHEDMLATGGSDGLIQCWQLEKDGRLTIPASPSVSLTGHTKAVKSVRFNPAAQHVLASTSMDMTIRLWDVEYGTERINIANKLEEPTWSVEFSLDGGLLACTSSDRVIRVFDPRSAARALVAMGCGHDSSRPQLLAWVSPTNLLSLGVNLRNERVLMLWDSRHLLDPLASQCIDPVASNAVQVPLYDEASKLLFTVGLGERSIHSYQLDPTASSSDFAQANLPFQMSGQTTLSAAALLPKQLCDVANAEVDQMLLLSSAAIEKISFVVPQNEKLRDYFRDDIFMPRRVYSGSCTSSMWFDGTNPVAEFQSMQPAGMAPASARTDDAPSSTRNSSFFKKMMEKEIKEQEMKQQAIARLTALAGQPSLHGQYQPKEQEQDASSDDDWEN